MGLFKAVTVGLVEIFAGLFLTVSVFLILYPQTTLEQGLNEPVNIGWIVALPWDISNTLRAPIGGPVSVMLSAIMAGVLLFGFLLAPVYYILGYPQRIYHPARQPGLMSELLYIDKGRSLGDVETAIEGLPPSVLGLSKTSNSSSSQSNGRRSFGGNNGGSYRNQPFPDFISSAFFLIAEENVECRKLILCHAHGILHGLPERYAKFMRFFSKRAMSVPEDYKSAVVLGLKEQSNCLKAYKCEKEITSTLKNSLYNLISSDLKKLWKLQKLS